MKVSIEIEIPDGCELGPGIVVTYIDPEKGLLHASARLDLTEYEFKDRPELSREILLAMARACRGGN